MAGKRRSDSFFGLHFDFHADPAAPNACAVGGRTTEQSVMDLLRAVQPDFVQCDCKGHPGWSSYPTKAGLPYPAITGDPLRTWRGATARMGVALYLHYSGVVDTQACRRHPDWARVTPERVTDTWATSTFGPYADELLIPQLMELAGEYGADGVWVDGECWGTQADYGHRALVRFREATGADLTLHPPVKREDARFHEYRDFCREQFRKYLRHYVDVVHRRYPGFQIASNWAFSTVMPEAVSAGVDFLSGDFSPMDAVNSARFESRYLAAQGMPWDLMAWGFSVPNNEHIIKSEAQLKQEAACVLSLGGGFQCYTNQRPDGSIRQKQAESLAGLARFCRERQPWCHRAEPVPQAALLYSTADHYRVSEHLFQHDKTEALQGMTQLLCETQQSFEIRSEHNLAGRMKRWPLIVVPELQYLEEGFRLELLEYAREGGSLLLAGPGAVGLFAGELGVSLAPRGGALYFSPDGEAWASCGGRSARMEVSGDAEEIGFCSGEEDGDGDRAAAASLFMYGRGKIACLPLDLGLSYKTRKAPAVRALIRALTGRLYEPVAEARGSVYVDMTVLQRDGRLLIQLVNTAGPHESAAWCGIDDIPAVGPVSVSVRLNRAPKSLRIVPSGQDARGEWKDGRFRFTLDRLELHEIAEIEP